MEFALRAARMGIWQLDLSSGRISWSESLDNLGGAPTVPRPTTLDEFLDTLTEADRARVRAAVDHSMATGEDLATEFTVQLPDGTERRMETHARISVDAGGAPKEIIGVGIDVTERRSTEMQLQQAQKMEAIGRLAGGIAHDFNNQLAVILGFCDLALAGVDPDGQVATDLAEVRNAGQRATALTRQLLAFSRRQVLKIEPLDLNDVVRNLERLLARLIGEDVTCDLRLDSTVLRIQADAGQIEHAITNLAVNARDAMPEGGRLTIATSSAELTEVDIRQRPLMSPGGYTVLVGDRHRGGDGRGGPGAHLRAVLHHQGGRQGHGPRAVHRLWHRAADGRLHLGLQRSRPRDDLPPVLPGDRRRRPRRRGRARRAASGGLGDDSGGRGRGRRARVRHPSVARPRIHRARGQQRPGGDRGARRGRRVRFWCCSTWCCRTRPGPIRLPACPGRRGPCSCPATPSDTSTTGSSPANCGCSRSRSRCRILLRRVHATLLEPSPTPDGPSPAHRSPCR